MTYTQLREALQVLGLGDRASLRQIKRRHRELIKAHHPDASPDADPEMIRKVNAAYRVIDEYVTAYRYSFCEEEFYEQNPDEQLRRQFMDDPFWGKG
ncbi:J domain-containing protein [Geomonas sp. RF6]|uniref:J domain-containing protein n=1 Tax=Geomonas sp. RF6 TaxID=2897342 RepID=UPI001E316AF8|nr:J domain-containing protein [Geomonas sp. RF6]UFS69989.1 J domain-containing protein [Geomonas sp. RF6]